MNEKRFIKPLLEKLKDRGISFKTVVADAQYDSAKVRETVRECGAEPVIPYRKSSKIKHTLRVGYDFVVHGAKRLVNLFRKRVCVERVFSRAKEWLLLDYLRARGLEQAFIHACLSFTTMITVALTAARENQLRFMRSVKHYTTR